MIYVPHLILIENNHKPIIIYSNNACSVSNIPYTSLCRGY